MELLHTRDYEVLGSRILCPDRPERVKILSWAKQRFPKTVHQGRLPQDKLKEAWESFIGAGLVPLDWAECQQRAFNEFPKDSTSATQTPSKISQMCLLASDVKGILTAEALAREAIARFEPWGLPQPEKIVWSFVNSAPRERNVELRPIHQAPWFGIFGALSRCGLYPSPNMTLQREMQRRRAQMHASAKTTWEAAISTAIQETNIDEGWRYAASEGWSVPAFGAKRAPVGALFRQLRSPMEPLLAIWSLGYALLLLNEDAAIILIR